MATIIIIDDGRVPRARVQIFDDDLGTAIMSTPLAVAAGGTHRDKSADGPGVIAQQTVGGDLTTVVMGSGDILYFNGTSVVVLPGNNTTDRKYLMSRALVPGTPAPSYEGLLATDITGGALPVARGGTGADMSITSGVLVQSTIGSAVSTTTTPTVSGLTVGIPVEDLDSAITMKAKLGRWCTLLMGNATGAQAWYLIHNLGEDGEQGILRIFNTATNANALVLDTASNLTAVGITAIAGAAASPRNMHTLGSPARASTDGTDATPVATEFYVAEIYVPVNVSATGVATFNGSVASGNFKVGLFSSSGSLLATSASTAMSGTDTYQRVAFTAPYAAKGPATYFVGLFIDNNTARYNTHAVGVGATAKATGQVYATGFTAITPPTTFTAGLGPIAGLY